MLVPSSILSEDAKKKNNSYNDNTQKDPDKTVFLIFDLYSFRGGGGVVASLGVLVVEISLTAAFQAIDVACHHHLIWSP